MPFDSTPAIADPIALFRQRRESAAALWEKVSVEQFDMMEWGKADCGTAACALGWLAMLEHDEWHYGGAYGSYPVRPDSDLIFGGAALYFGITTGQAYDCFGTTSAASRFHGRVRICDVTPADVARSLLALPYAVGVEA